jgi:hypothetical protein
MQWQDEWSSSSSPERFWEVSPDISQRNETPPRQPMHLVMSIRIAFDFGIPFLPGPESIS